MTTLRDDNLMTMQAYLDDELSAAARQQFEQRLYNEPSLATALEQEQQLRRALQSRLRQTVVPVSLRAAVEQALPQPAPEPPPAPSWWLKPLQLRPLSMVVGLLLWSLGLGSMLWLLAQPLPQENHSVFRQLGGKHAVYLQNNKAALDVDGDSAAIRQWFAERLPFALPPLPQLEAWHLEGARLGEFHHLPTIHVVYEQDPDNEHLHFSLTIFTPRPTDFPATSQQIINGQSFYVGQVNQQTTILWQKNDLGYALVGDPPLSEQTLLHIAEQIRNP